MPFDSRAPFQMPFGQAGFSGPPSPGNMSAVGSLATGVMDPESIQQGGSPRADSPSSDSEEGLECRKQCTFDEQMQRQQDGRHLGAGNCSCLHSPGLGSSCRDSQARKAWATSVTDSL